MSENKIRLKNQKPNSTNSTCLGPGSNLENFVEKEWWNHIFNSFYLKIDGDVIEDQVITSFEVDLITEILNLRSDQKILNLCCGQGRHSLELNKRGIREIEGLDRSHYLIQKARKSTKDKGFDIKFREGDARKLPYSSDIFHVILLLGNSFGYFESISDDLTF